MGLRKKEKEKTENRLPEHVQRMFDERKTKVVVSRFRGSKSNYIKLGILVATILLILFYYLIPTSHVKNVNISGIHYLTVNQVKDKSDVNENSIYYLTIPILVEQRINSLPLIESSKVNLDKDNFVSIDIVEKKVIGYRYDQEPELLMADNTQTALMEEYMPIISYVPLITGFLDEEETRKLSTAFKSIDVDIIEDMAEVKQYDLGYDSQGIVVLMRNGGYFIANYRSLPMINKYYDIYNYLKDKNQCIFADDSQETAYAKACPWHEEQIVHEYWLDEKGEPIKNAYGDKVVKHYYTLEDGTTALDASGNPIVIPINVQGFEERDPDFIANYEAGYYATGELYIP
ncbi:MAG: FtsQ-type POTRA domain-containing protein [Solobacterium sp.]|nr:FtsQ-type POTRA domain-containing protein [Solobacterium sp.]